LAGNATKKTKKVEGVFRLREDSITNQEKGERKKGSSNHTRRKKSTGQGKRKNSQAEKADGVKPPKPGDEEGKDMLHHKIIKEAFQGGREFRYQENVIANSTVIKKAIKTAKN